MFVEHLVNSYNKENAHSYQTSLSLYERARELALFEGASEVQAATFATWCATLAGSSEPHPLHPPVRIAGLNRLFARKAWGEYYCKSLRPPKPCSKENIMRDPWTYKDNPFCFAYRLCVERWTQYVPRLQDFFDLEGDYEAGFKAVLDLIRKKVEV